MDAEIITNEIRDFFNRMGFTDDVRAIDVHTGISSRYSVWLDRGPSYPICDADERPSGSLVNMLIGEHGNNLAAAEHLIKRILRKKYGAEEKFTLDINDYRMQRLEDLKQAVKDAAKAVRIYNRPVPLRAMSAFERRIVHLLLAEYPDIATESMGQEPERKVVIKPFP